jgi:hypothetical protein
MKLGGDDSEKGLEAYIHICMPYRNFAERTREE